MDKYTHLALDGPLNGQYVGTEAARLGYRRDQWPTGEWVWVHGKLLEDQDEPETEA